jgi:hypothetical protein
MFATISNDQRSHVWYLVRFVSGSVAVVSSEDLALLVSGGMVDFMAKVSAEEGRTFEAAKAAICPRPVV